MIITIIKKKILAFTKKDITHIATAVIIIITEDIITIIIIIIKEKVDIIKNMKEEKLKS